MADGGEPDGAPMLKRKSSLEEGEPKEPGNPADEKKKIKKQMGFKVAAGKTFYLLDATWWKQWCDWVGYESNSVPAPGACERPGDIDNSRLLVPNGAAGKLKQSIVENSDFIILNDTVWKLFKTWYAGGPEIARDAILNQSKKAFVELHGLTLSVCKSSAPSDTRALIISEQSTAGALKVKASQALGLDPKKVKLWDYFRGAPFQSLEDQLKQTLTNCRIMDNNEIMLEEPDKDGKYTLKKSAGGGGGMEQQGGNCVTSSQRPPCRGVVGLTNLGNTCFMNSTLQCISNLPPLRDYFVEGKHSADINRNNPLGHSGKLAESFAELLQLMWPTNEATPVSCVAPRDFKYQIGTFAPQFAGYQQHDSSELMQFLLDGLHEDLNRIIQKPATQNPDANGRPDAVVAAEFLEVYMKRNSSRVVDLFCGQFKTTLVCPGGPDGTCKNVAILFDPYFSVQLPLLSLADQGKSRFTVTMYYMDKPSQVLTCMITKGLSAKALIDDVVAQTGVPRERLIVCELARNYLQSVFNDYKGLEWVRSNDILAAYEVPDAAAFHKDVYRGGNGKYKLGQRCQALFKGTWYDGEITYVSNMGEPRYSFRYDVDGLTSNQWPEAKLRELPPAEGAEVPEKKDEPEEQTATALYFRKEVSRKYGTTTTTSKELYKHPRLFTHPTMASEADVYAAVSKVLGKPVEEFTLTVVNQYAYSDGNSNPVLNPKEDKKYQMRQRLYLCLDWVPGVVDPEAAAEGDDSKDEVEGKAVDSFDVAKAFQMFREVEKLGENDAWYCGKCKNHVQANKQMELWTLPPVLILHLKRFSYTRYNRDKLNDFVSFPLEGLDMREHCLSPNQVETLYDCAAVSNHHGSLGGGHYTAYGRSSIDGGWYLFDDSSTRRVNPSEVVTSAAYIIYYLRRDFRPASWGARAP